MIRALVLACSFLLTLASCGRAPEAAVSNLSLEETDEHLRIYHGERNVLTYWLQPQLPDSLPAHYTRNGFIHPVRSPDGTVITDDFPVGHAHQHGVFSAWTKTTFRDSFVDFWNQQKGLGTVEHRELLETIDEPGFLGFTTRLIHRSLEHGAVLQEDLTVRVHDRDDMFVWDLRSEQTNVSTDTLFLEKHVYGGFGFRGHRHWNEADSASFVSPARFLTSTGLDRAAANHTRPEWTAMFGEVGGATAGMAVISHPENFRHPQPVRVHPEMPYFSVSPVVEEGFYLAPQAEYLSRFRIVVFDGEPQPKVLDGLRWREY